MKPNQNEIEQTTVHHVKRRATIEDELAKQLAEDPKFEATCVLCGHVQILISHGDCPPLNEEQEYVTTGFSRVKGCPTRVLYERVEEPMLCPGCGQEWKFKARRIKEAS